MYEIIKNLKGKGANKNIKYLFILVAAGVLIVLKLIMSGNEQDCAVVLFCKGIYFLTCVVIYGMCAAAFAIYKDGISYILLKFLTLAYAFIHKYKIK